MKVAVIVPIYNVELYLNQFMDSLCRQTFQDFNIIAVDDASRDRSTEILETYKNYFGKRLVIIHNEINVGPGMTRNIGLEYVREDNEYVSFLDSDDYLQDNFFEKMVSAADNDAADIVICGCDRFDSLTGKKSDGEMLENPEEVISDIPNCRELAYINTFVWNKLFRRKAIAGTQFPPMKRWEDVMFLFQVISGINRIKFINEILYHYRSRSSSLTGSFTYEMCESALSGLRNEIMRFQQTERYGVVREQFEVQVFLRCGVGGVCRVSKKNMKNAGFYVKRMKEYMDTVIPEWRNNRYLIVRNCSSRSYKENALALAALLYKQDLFILFIWAYWFLMNILRKDIRW